MQFEYGTAAKWLHWMAIAVLVAVRMLAARYHHFFLRNDVLRRMTVGVAGERRLDG